MTLLLENNIRGGICSVMGDRHAKSDGNKKTLYIDAEIFCGHAKSQPLPYDEIETWRSHAEDYMAKLEETLKTPHYSDIGYFLEVDIKYFCNFLLLLKIQNWFWLISFPPENNKIDFERITTYMSENKPDGFTQNRKLICDWSDKKNYLSHYNMLEFYIKHGMIIDKVHEIISYKQSKRFGKCIDFNSEEKKLAVYAFEKLFYKLLNNAVSGKTMENVRNRVKFVFIKKADNEKIIEENQTQSSMEYINLIQNMMAAHSSKTKYLWINRFTQDLQFWNWVNCWFLKRIVINYNLILFKKIYSYIICILIVLG